MRSSTGLFMFSGLKIIILLFGSQVSGNSVAVVGLGMLDFALKIADIVNMATDDHDTQFYEVNRHLDILQNEMNKSFKELEYKSDRIPLVNQLNSDAKNIDSCYKDFEYFMNSKTIPEKEKLVECGKNVRKDFRQVAQIAKEESYQLNPSKVYQDTIEHEEFCNTTNLVNIHNYLIQLYMKGCATGIMSERIRTNGTSNVIYNECQSNILNITIYFDSVLSGCFKMDTCKMVFDFVKSVLSQTEQELVEYNSILRGRFPWYKFMLFKAFKDPLDKRYVSGDKIPSVASVTVGDICFLVLWTPFYVQPRDSNSFRMVLDKVTLNGKYIGMNVTQEIVGEKLVISGYLDHGSESLPLNQQCTGDEVTSGTKFISPPNMAFLLVLVLAIFRM